MSNSCCYLSIFRALFLLLLIFPTLCCAPILQLNKDAQLVVDRAAACENAKNTIAVGQAVMGTTVNTPESADYWYKWIKGGEFAVAIYCMPE